MAGTCSGELTGAEFKYAQPYGHEHISIIIGIDQLVDPLKYFRRRASHQGMVVDKDLRGHHKQCRRNTLSGYVCDDHGKMIFVDHKEVIEISADLFGRIH